MRFLLRPLFIYLVALTFLWKILPFLHFTSQNTLVFAALALFMLNVVLKPFIKILLLPINIITLGLFSWMVHVVVIFLATLVVPGFTLTAASFPALRIGHYLIPAINLSIVWTYLLFSFLVSVTVAFFDWLLTKRE